jgi:hypothetical protein
MLVIDVWSNCVPRQSVRIRNISSEGLSVRLQSRCPVGTWLNFDLPGEGLRYGEVMWSEGLLVGIRLTTSIDPETVLNSFKGGESARPIYADTLLMHIGRGKRPGLRSDR